MYNLLYNKVIKSSTKILIRKIIVEKKREYSNFFVLYLLKIYAVRHTESLGINQWKGQKNESQKRET